MIWHVIEREDFKAFMRMSKYSIPVQPKRKDDDCIVFLKTFRVLKFLNCCLLKKETYQDDSVELMEMDVFDHGDWQQVVCWNVNESVKLSSILPVELCSFCASHNWIVARLSNLYFLLISVFFVCFCKQYKMPSKLFKNALKPTITSSAAVSHVRSLRSNVRKASKISCSLYPLYSYTTIFDVNSEKKSVLNKSKYF